MLCYLILSYLNLSYLLLSYLMLCYVILSYLILSYLILSCLHCPILDDVRSKNNAQNSRIRSKILTAPHTADRSPPRKTSQSKKYGSTIKGAPLYLFLPLTVRGHGIDPRSPLPTPQCSRYEGREIHLQRTAIIKHIFIIIILQYFMHFFHSSFSRFFFLLIDSCQSFSSFSSYFFFLLPRNLSSYSTVD